MILWKKFLKFEKKQIKTSIIDEKPVVYNKSIVYNSKVVDKKIQVKNIWFTEVVDKKTQVKHIWFPENDERQKLVKYAYKIGGKDFLLTILAENSTMQIDRKSIIVGSNWYSDYWLCQINIWYHPEILSNWKNWKKFKDWFYDPYKQLDYCQKLFSWWVRFYWYDKRHTVKKNILFY
jgi:hypothetical protein